MCLVWSIQLKASTCTRLTESLLLGAAWVMILMTFMVQHFRELIYNGNSSWYGEYIIA